MQGCACWRYTVDRGARERAAWWRHRRPRFGAATLGRCCTRLWAACRTAGGGCADSAAACASTRTCLCDWTAAARLCRTAGTVRAKSSPMRPRDPRCDPRVRVPVVTRRQAAGPALGTMPARPATPRGRRRRSRGGCAAAAGRAGAPTPPGPPTGCASASRPEAAEQ